MKTGLLRFRLLLFLATTIVLQGATPPLHVEGKYFKDPNGNIVILRGVAMIHVPDMDTTRPGHRFMIDQVTTAANGWYARVIRIGVRVETYLSNPANLVNNYLKPAVDYCTSKGFYCIVDWHPITDARNFDSQTRQFWNHVAPIFAGYENVLYEVFNEHSVDTSWAEWKNVAQPWVNIIRSHAPNNIILIGGPFYSQHIQGAATSPFTGSNLAYVGHVYPGGWYPQGWEGNIGVVANHHPVVITEWGYDPDAPDSVTRGTRSNFGIPFQDWAESKGLSWIAWVSDHAWGPPMFHSNWTPKDFGSFAKDWLFNKRNSNQPNDGATFTTSATANPSTVAAGATTTISADVTCNTGTLNNGIVDLEIYNSAGTRVDQRFWTNQNFTAGSGFTYTWDWSTTTVGTYTLRIGVFTAGWADTLHWNSGAATITVNSPPPAPPTGLSATTVSACQVNLSWTASPGATSYNVKRSATSGGPYTIIQMGVTGTTYSDTGRAAGTTYYYVVSAVNSSGQSANSTQAGATTTPVPAAPSALNATAVSSTQVDLLWNNNSATEDGFKIERSTDNVTFAQIATVGANVTSYSNTGLSSGTTYYYRVRAYDACGNNSPYSNTDSATPAPPSFSSSAQAAPMTVAKGVSTTITVTITCNTGVLTDGIVDLEIYNSAGTRVGQQFWTGQNFAAGQSSNYTWSWSSTNTGTYTVRIGVFTAGWANTLHWNAAAGTIYVVTTTIRRNSGGPAVNWFSADANFSGGTAASTTATINTASASNAAPAAVYQTERYGAFSYTIPGLSVGAAYTVRLHFAEIYWTQAGQRKFHVNINGLRVLTDYDIVAAAGAPNKAIIREFTAVANTSGQIVIQYLNGSVNFAKSSGIEIIR